MKIYPISIFPEIFDSFIQTSLIAKAQEKGVLKFEKINPRDFCEDKHKQVDDTIYGGGAGMLLKAKPFIDAVENVIKNIDSNNFSIIFPSPSKEIFTQKQSHLFSKYEHLIFVCARYEGLDHRFEQYFMDKYPDNFIKISLGKFITLGGEVPAMTMIESIVRLVPGVIKEAESWEKESYNVKDNLSNIEHPNYTKPQEIYGYKIPEILLSGDDKKIQEWRDENSFDIN